MRPGRSIAAMRVRQSMPPLNFGVCSVERQRVQLDDDVPAGVGEGGDDLFAGDVQRRCRRPGRRVERGRPAAVRVRAPSRTAAASYSPLTSRSTFGKPTSTARSRVDQAGREIALHAIAIDEQHAIELVKGDRQVRRVVEVVLAGDAVEDVGVAARSGAARDASTDRRSDRDPSAATPLRGG